MPPARSTSGTGSNPGRTQSPADVVIEAFACEPFQPTTLMPWRDLRPQAWINLEYLSAESWVDGCHGLPSPHPRLPLGKYFFFPGFEQPHWRTAARRRLRRLRRAAFDEAAFRAEFALPPRDPDELLISVFAYPRNRLPELLPALEHSPRPIRLLLAGTEATARRQGSLSVHALPFLPQVRYDEILWAGDLNFVRGEDSFVRAQWAGKPFVWQIYPQAEDAHFTKLDAFLDHHPAGALLRPFWHAWNGRGALDWPAFAALLPTLKAPARRWAQHLRTHPDLAAALVHFCRERLK
jgi:uncharacterized repeat protein (TIGR03837 family)